MTGHTFPTIWSHNGVIDYIGASEEIRAQLSKEAAAYALPGTFTVPTRRALLIAKDAGAVLDVGTGTLKDAALEEKLSEVVPKVEWDAAVVKMGAVVEVVDEKPIDDLKEVAG